MTYRGATNRTLVIGDVHGCIEELRDLLSTCRFDPTTDSVVFVGDLVGKGPASAEVVTFCRELGARSVMGNHDHAFVTFDLAQRSGRPGRLRAEHAAAAQLLTQEDWRYLHALPLQIRLPEYGVRVVHAGLVPGVAYDNQDPHMLMNIRTAAADGSGSARWDGGELWATRYRGPDFVIFGHHARAGLQQHAHAVGLDSGCVYGGKLSAYILPDARVVSVDAKATYAAVPGRSPRRVAGQAS